MKKLLALVLFAALCGLLRAADTPPQPDWQAVAQAIRQQRDTVTQSLQDAQVQLEAEAKQIADLQAKVADLQKQLDAAKPSQAKTDTNLKTETVPAASK